MCECATLEKEQIGDLGSAALLRAETPAKQTRTVEHGGGYDRTHDGGVTVPHCRRLGQASKCPTAWNGRLRLDHFGPGACADAYSHVAWLPPYTNHPACSHRLIVRLAVQLSRQALPSHSTDVFCSLIPPATRKTFLFASSLHGIDALLPPTSRSRRIAQGIPTMSSNARNLRVNLERPCAHMRTCKPFRQPWLVPFFSTKCLAAPAEASAVTARGPKLPSRLPHGSPSERDDAQPPSDTLIPGPSARGELPSWSPLDSVIVLGECFCAIFTLYIRNSKASR